MGLNLTKNELQRMGQRIKKQIFKEYRSLELFAYENDISKKTVYHIVNGERDPRISTLRKIAHSLKISISELINF